MSVSDSQVTAPSMAGAFTSVSPYDVARIVGAEVAAVAQQELGVDVGDALVRQSPPNQAGDLQSSIALRLAKQHGLNPLEAAQTIASGMAASAVTEPPTVSGNGFVNFRLKTDYIEDAVATLAGDERLDVPLAAKPRRVVLDYSAPNVAKEMHVGHLRSTIIGDALRRMLEYVGHDVIPQNHLGEWGTPFGMLIEYVIDTGGQGSNGKVDDLTRVYQEARKKYDSDPAFAERARERVVLLQQGDPESLEIWRRLRKVSEDYFQQIYDLLGVGLTPEHNVGESFYASQLQSVVDELSERGLLTEDDGALCMFLPGYVTREGEPMPIIVQKSDGAFNYDTTDLAAIRYRLKDLHATAILYVVGAPQALHFRMLFDAAKAAGWADESVELRHIAFGSVLGEDGKMLRTRAGETVKLIELLEEAVSRAGDLLEDRDVGSADRASLARSLGIGAVKYADLSSDRIRDYTFSFDRMLSFEGHTSVYLQYAYARVRSLLRKHGDALDFTAPVRLEHAEERALALLLMRFGSDLSVAIEQMQPHKICSYLQDLAAQFSRFYESCPIGDADADMKRSRLLLSDATGRTLATGLNLLGVEAPERL